MLYKDDISQFFDYLIGGVNLNDINMSIDKDVEIFDGIKKTRHPVYYIFKYTQN